MRLNVASKLSLLLPAILIISGCSREPDVQESENTLVDGSCQSVYDGEICTYGIMNGDKVVEYGATVALTTVENAPLDEQPVFPPINLARIPFPEAIQTAAGINHLGVNWEVQGHPPKTFQTPHFDFHFYMADGAMVDGIDCSDTSKPDIVPTGYELHDMPIPGTDMTLVGTCVPQMGMHAVNAVESAASDPFDATMIVGYYSREPIFVEPMIARDLLMGRQDFALDVPVVEGAGQMPVSFEGTFEAESNSYRLKFTM